MKKIAKVLTCGLLLIIGLFIMSISVDAASASISADSGSIEVGDTIKVTGKVTAAQWSLNITVKGQSIASSSELDNYESNISKSFSGTYTATEAGTITFTLTGDVTDFDQTNTLINKTVSVTVKEKETPPPDDEEDDEPELPSMNFSSTNKTMYATDSLNVRSSYTTNADNIIGSLSVGQSVTVTGIGDGWTRISYGGQTAYVISSGLTDKKPVEEQEEKKPEENDDENQDDNEEDNKEKSNIKTLSSLSVGEYQLTPSFNPDVTEYSLTVGPDVDSLNIEAITEDANAKLEVIGNTNILIGENTVNIKVTAENGTVRTYTINVTKVAEIGEQLSELSVEGYTLTPEFNKDVYEYTLDIGDTSITSLNINAKANNENITIDIAGNNDLKPGKNIITILVTSAEDNLTTTYQIVVNINEAYKEPQIIAGINDKDLFLYGGIGVGVIIVIIIVIVIVKKRKSTDDDDDDFAPNESDWSMNEKNSWMSENNESKNDEPDNNGDTNTVATSRRRGKHF